MKLIHLWKNFRFLNICHVQKFEISPHDRFFLHGHCPCVRDKYEVWRHPSTSTLKLNQKIPTPTNPPVPIVRTTRQVSKAARNEQTTGGKTARNEERSRTQSLSELKVRQQPSSSSCAGKTNATRSRLYVQRKTPAATSNYGAGSRSTCQQSMQDESRHGRSSGRQEMLGGSRSKSVSSVLSGREEGIENVRRGTQIQRAVGAGGSGSSGTIKQTKEFSYREKSCGKRGPMSKSIPNLCSPRQHLVETEQKAMTRGDQVDTSSSKSFTNKWNPAGHSSTTDKKRPTQGSASQTSRVCRKPNERKNSKDMKSLPRETEPAFRRPSIHQSLININRECEEVVPQIFDSISFFFR